MVADAPRLCNPTALGHDAVDDFAARRGGRGASEGAYVKYLSDGHDGYDCCAWIIAQSWSNGRNTVASMRTGGNSAFMAAASMTGIAAPQSGPWTRGNREDTHAGDVEFGPEAAFAGHVAARYLDQRTRWFDRFLKGEANGVDAEPTVRASRRTEFFSMPPGLRSCCCRSLLVRGMLRSCDECLDRYGGSSR